MCADLDYDVYHAAVDCENDVATQLFYIRSRTGDNVWDIARAAKLHYFLETAIQVGLLSPVSTSGF